MSSRDRFRASLAVILLIMGIIIVVRAFSDLRAWPIMILGIIFVALGLYRLNQIRVYMQSGG